MFLALENISIGPNLFRLVLSFYGAYLLLVFIQIRALDFELKLVQLYWEENSKLFCKSDSFWKNKFWKKRKNIQCLFCPGFIPLSRLLYPGVKPGVKLITFPPKLRDKSDLFQLCTLILSDKLRLHCHWLMCDSKESPEI